jgi:hypothetical protein
MKTLAVEKDSAMEARFLACTLCVSNNIFSQNINTHTLYLTQHTKGMPPTTGNWGPKQDKELGNLLHTNVVDYQTERHRTFMKSPKVLPQIHLSRCRQEEQRSPAHVRQVPTLRIRPYDKETW